MEVTISDDESPRHRKKARKHHVKSDHRHDYEGGVHRRRLVRNHA